MKPSSTSSSAASSNAGASGSSVRSSPITSSLTQSVSNASRASLAVSTASRAVKQPGRVGEQAHAGGVEHVDDRPALTGLDPPQRDGHQLGAGRLDRGGQRVERAEPAGAEQQAGTELRTGDGERIGGYVGRRHCQPPWIARRISTRAPSSSLCVSHCVRGTTSSVDRDGDAAGGRRQVERVDRRLHGRAVGQLGLGAVEQDLHAGTPANRRGSAGAAHSGSGSPVSAPATRSAVTGASRIPLR